jgi:hypothetical protein
VGIVAADAVEHIRWRLWHGQLQRALDLIGDTLAALDAVATMVSPTSLAASKARRLLRALETYVVGQVADHRLCGSATRCGANRRHRRRVLCSGYFIVGWLRTSRCAGRRGERI